MQDIQHEESWSSTAVLVTRSVALLVRALSANADVIVRPLPLDQVRLNKD